LVVKYQSAHRWPRAINFNPHHLVLWSFLGLPQWVYVRDDMSKGLKIMSLGVINHGMPLSVLYIIWTLRQLFSKKSAQKSHLFTFFQYKINVITNVQWLKQSNISILSIEMLLSCLPLFPLESWNGMFNL
jgi:hypothetical protein